MKSILKCQNFNESKGISDSCEKITDSIYDTIEPDIIDSISSFKKFDFNEDDFKLNDIEIDYILTKSKENSCNAISNLTTSPKIILNINYNILNEPFLYYIKSVIFHEILHVFQHYNLKNKFRPESFSIGSVIPQIRQDIKSKYVNYILDILYYSLSHELSAQIHQYYMYKREDKDYSKLKDIIKLLDNFYIKSLDKEENIELDFIKTHILNSIKFYTKNKKYEKDISKSIWIESNREFLNKLSDIIKIKLKWLYKKIKLVDSKIGIKYDETFTYYGKLEDYQYIDTFNFIKGNLNDCHPIENI